MYHPLHVHILCTLYMYMYCVRTVHDSAVRTCTYTMYTYTNDHVHSALQERESKVTESKRNRAKKEHTEQHNHTQVQAA